MPRRGTKHKKQHHKKVKRTRSKKMKGGAALFQAPGSPGSSSVTYSNVGPGMTYKNSFNAKSDIPKGAVSVINYTPRPIFDLFYSAQTNFQNFMNELLGKPRIATSSPTDQPALDKPVDVIAKPVTKAQFDTFKDKILKTYNS